MNKIPLTVLEGIVLLTISLIGVLQGIYLVRNTDPFALYDKIGPGRSLVFVSLLLMGAVIVYLIRHTHISAGQTQRVSWRGATGNVGRVTGLVVAYIVLIDVVSLLPATVVFLLVIFRLLGVKSWLQSSILSVALSISIYLLFVRALHMELPGGLFFD